MALEIERDREREREKERVAGRVKEKYLMEGLYLERELGTQKTKMR